MFLDGEPAKTDVVRDHLDGPATVRSFQIGFRDRDQGFKSGGVADLQVFDRELSALEIAELHRPGALAAAVERAVSIPGEVDAGLAQFFARSVDEECRAASGSLRNARAAWQDVLDSLPEIMVMEETGYPRESFVLIRGQYDQPDRARPVQADRAVAALAPFDAAWARNRLGLASWTTDPRNPLAARVAVNRLWAICFGRGIVGTLENFGLQGEAPFLGYPRHAHRVDFKGGWTSRPCGSRVRRRPSGSRRS